MTDPSARLSIEADLQLVDHFDEQLRHLELQLSRSAKDAVADGKLDARRYESYCHLFAGDLD